LSADRSPVRVTRRSALGLAAAALASTLAGSRVSLARGRTPLAGHLSMRVPWPVSTIDPHRLDDPAAMLFGGALFESLFAIDAGGRETAVLAETLPELTPEGVKVTLRQGVRFASGEPITAKDVVRSLARARSFGAGGWLDPAGTVRVASPTTLVFSARAVASVVRALASPLVSIVRETFTPEHPFGTGPFVATQLDGSLALLRNPQAASGPAFLDAVVVSPAADLAASLRAFESGQDDLGWLGMGLHEPRKGAVPFDAGAVGWAILRTGDAAGRWNLPGVAQRLADGIDPGPLAQLGIKPDWTVEPDEGWGGPPAPLLVRDDCPWLIELARVVSAGLSRPGHEVTVRPTPRADFDAARMSRNYALAIDVSRPFDRSPFGVFAALAATEDAVRGAELARRPPLFASGASPRLMARLLRVGVLADVRMQGGHMPSVPLPTLPCGYGIDFGSIALPRPSVP
jgi:peptide/nickel transport system substrate-binding protein